AARDPARRVAHAHRPGVATLRRGRATDQPAPHPYPERGCHDALAAAVLPPDGIARARVYDAVGARRPRRRGMGHAHRRRALRGGSRAHRASRSHDPRAGHLLPRRAPRRGQPGPRAPPRPHPPARPTPALPALPRPLRLRARPDRRASLALPAPALAAPRPVSQRARRRSVRMPTLAPTIAMAMVITVVM